MSEELKPVNCGCGGEAEVIFPFMHTDMYLIECNECGICTSSYNTEAEAVTAWNRAMGGNVQDCAKDARCSERTAKAEYSNADGEYLCSECGRVVQIEDAYCCGCGCRLEWNE